MDLISRQEAIDALGEEPEIWFEDDNDYDLGMRAQWRIDVSALKALPSAEPEIIYCKDCKKHNLPPYCYYQGRYISVVDSCPLVPIRGLSQGHEFDYQYCVYAERRTDD